VLSHGVPNLLFVEFAVNDGRTPESHRRAMEGIVRQARRANPACDIVFIYTTHQMNEGKRPASAADHAAVAEYYGIPQIDVGCEIWKKIADGEGTWETYVMDYAHPNGVGHALYIDKVVSYLKEALVPGNAEVKPLPAPMMEDCMENGRMIEMAPLCQPPFTVEKYQFGTYNFRLLCSDQPGAKVTVPFVGRMAGVYWHITEYTGNIRFRVDGGEWQEAPTWDGWVDQYPNRINYRQLVDNLPAGEHVMEIEVAGTKDELAKDCRIEIESVFCG